MNMARREAFSDGVIAIIITILVLEMKVPHGSEWKDIAPLWPLFLSYVLSFVNVGIYWNNHHHIDPVPVAAYSFVLLMCGVAYTLLQKAIIAANGTNSALAAAVGADTKGKISVLTNLAAVPLAFVYSWIAAALFILVALMWFVPDRRIEKVIA